MDIDAEETPEYIGSQVVTECLAVRAWPSSRLPPVFRNQLLREQNPAGFSMAAQHSSR